MRGDIVIFPINSSKGQTSDPVRKVLDPAEQESPDPHHSGAKGANNETCQS